MSVASVNASGVFRVGDVMSQAWRIFTGNVLFFLAVPLVVYVLTAFAIAFFASMFAIAGWVTTAIGLVWIGVFLAVILALGLNVIGQAVVLIGAFQRLRRQPLRVGEAIQKALARFFPLFGLVLLWGLALAVCLVLSVFILSGLIWVFGGGGMVMVPAILSPIVLAPTAFFFVMWVVVVPATVVEGLSPLASMIRSTGLTKGYRWKIFGIMLLLGLLLVVGFIVQLILTPVSQVLATIFGTIWFVGWTAYWNCAIIMTYHDLRVAKEGIDTEQIASIFD
jgi:hypothetical protein